MRWLDLRGTGLSALERLAAEELLLRHDPGGRPWAVVGGHEPVDNRVLRAHVPPRVDRRARRGDDDAYGHADGGPNRSCAVILGIGGKPERLIDVDAAIDDGVLVLRRFSGGGTVVVDHSSLWTTFIGRHGAPVGVKHYPREIMEWSAGEIFGPAFERWNEEAAARSSENTRGGDGGRRTLVFEGKSCGLSGGVGESLVLPPRRGDDGRDRNASPPTFALRENDYVLGTRKVGGNAQCVAREGFLHHTSFLWDYDVSNMAYLTLPDKRPEYRGERSHGDFLVRLKDHYGGGGRSSEGSFFGHLKAAAAERFELEEAGLDDVLRIADEKFGGFQEWFDGKCRTRVVNL